MMKRLLVAAVATIGLLSAATAQTWPTHAITYIVPFQAGGSTDTLSRILSDKLKDRLGQPVIIENRGGVGGMIGVAHLASSAPDGYTIGLGNSASHTITPNIQTKVPYDPKADFTPISLLAEYANILVVNPRMPATDLKSFLKLAKERKGKLTYGSSGVGSSNHLSSELLASKAGVKFTHIPYKGNTQAMTDVVAGHVDWMFATASEVAPFVKSGQVRALGTSGLKPEALLPQVPPISQTLPGYEVIGFMALFAPANIPSTVANRLNKEVNAVLALPDIAEKYAAMGLKAVPSTQQQLAQRVAQDYDLWKNVIKEAGIKPE
ncbi:MAG TPA: tripartite tricarboxylate transporter substrate binding protein [Eoetvoesiella sp.]